MSNFHNSKPSNAQAPFPKPSLPLEILSIIISFIASPTSSPIPDPSSSTTIPTPTSHNTITQDLISLSLASPTLAHLSAPYLLRTLTLTISPSPRNVSFTPRTMTRLKALSKILSIPHINKHVRRVECTILEPIEVGVSSAGKPNDMLDENDFKRLTTFPNLEALQVHCGGYAPLDSMEGEGDTSPGVEFTTDSCTRTIYWPKYHDYKADYVTEQALSQSKPQWKQLNFRSFFDACLRGPGPSVPSPAPSSSTQLSSHFPPSLTHLELQNTSSVPLISLLSLNALKSLGLKKCTLTFDASLESLRGLVGAPVMSVGDDQEGNGEGKASMSTSNTEDIVNYLKSNKVSNLTSFKAIEVLINVIGHPSSSSSFTTPDYHPKPLETFSSSEPYTSPDSLWSSWSFPSSSSSSSSDRDPSPSPWSTSWSESWPSPLLPPTTPPHISLPWLFKDLEHLYLEDFVYSDAYHAHMRSTMAYVAQTSTETEAEIPDIDLDPKRSLNGQSKSKLTMELKPMFEYRQLKTLTCVGIVDFDVLHETGLGEFEKRDLQTPYSDSSHSSTSKSSNPFPLLQQFTFEETSSFPNDWLCSLYEEYYTSSRAIH
ncbi:hypothetical protein CVT24_006557 [Panaeolus cyanescens]|uniref:Uncharacterized protein n=1 Tax=Panaeolus cyanescens TaxID=181874 RepID=A0A409WBY8_9AGAR|nr:hypothetical protein CVT24_006557 [Panaeolus cyanescens]